MNNKDNKPLDFWNDHSLEFLEMALKRDYQERVVACDGFGKTTRDCGDTIEIYLMVKDKKIASISYDIKGCLFSHACANTLIELAQGQPVEKVKKIEPEDITVYLKTLPKAETHCARHAVKAFRLALDDYEKKIES